MKRRIFIQNETYERLRQAAEQRGPYGEPVRVRITKLVEEAVRTVPEPASGTAVDRLTM